MTYYKHYKYGEMQQKL